MVMATQDFDLDRDKSAARTDPLLVSAEEAARTLSISAKTLWTLTNEGEINPVRIGRRVLYSPLDLQSFISSRRKGSGLEMEASN